MKKLILIFVILTSCQKETVIPTQHTCSDWVGTWWQFAGDSIITDSLVITVDFYKDNEVYYRSNLFTSLHHPCPLKDKTDEIHIDYDGKSYYFRH